MNGRAWFALALLVGSVAYAAYAAWAVWFWGRDGF